MAPSGRFELPTGGLEGSRRPEAAISRRGVPTRICWAPLPLRPANESSGLARTTLVRWIIDRTPAPTCGSLFDGTYCAAKRIARDMSALTTMIRRVRLFPDRAEKVDAGQVGQAKVERDQGKIRSGEAIEGSRRIACQHDLVGEVREDALHKAPRARIVFDHESAMQGSAAPCSDPRPHAIRRRHVPRCCLRSTAPP